MRGIYLATFAILPIIGFALLSVSNNPNIKYMAVFFSAAGAFPGGPGFLGWGLNREFLFCRPRVSFFPPRGRLTVRRTNADIEVLPPQMPPALP